MSQVTRLCWCTKLQTLQRTLKSHSIITPIQISSHEVSNVTSYKCIPLNYFLRTYKDIKNECVTAFIHIISALGYTFFFFLLLHEQREDTL